MLDWRRLRTGLAILIALAISVPVSAAFKPKISVDASGGRAAVMINSWTAVRFHASNGQLSPAERAEITAQRLRLLVDQGFSPRSLSAKGDKSQGRVYSGDTLVCIASADDARLSRSTPLALAASWAASIRTLLLMPPVALSSKEIVVPAGENRRVNVGGSASGPIYVKSADPQTAVAAPCSDARCIQVTGILPGKTQVEVSVEGERAEVTIVVRKYAGRAPETAVAEVTGDPCPARLIAYAAGQAVSQGAALEPGASLEIGKIDAGSASLGPNQTRQFTIEVKITGAGYLPYSSKVNVEVRNVVLPREEPDQLFYSNYPERLLKYQTLFAAKLEPAKPTRVLYHHQNGMTKRVHLILEVINPHPEPATMRITSGLAAPSADTVGVGHIAGAAFLRHDQDNVSVIEKIPAQSRLVLVSNMLGQWDTASGIIQLKQMDGGAAYVRVTAAEPFVDNVARGTVASAPTQLLLPLSDHIYPSPAKILAADYKVGERWAFISIGKHALDDREAQKKLYGNYGVTYDISLKVQNPTGETKKVSVLFEPSAGLASGVFIIDGKFVLAKYAQPPSEVKLASYDLKPGEMRTVKIVTVPLAGSNYPANLIVRS